MVQSIQLDIIPFTAPVQEADFAFYTTKQDGLLPHTKRRFKPSSFILLQCLISCNLYMPNT
jgi:hypothetical protein